MDKKVKIISKYRMFTTLGAVLVIAVLAGLTSWPQGPDWFGIKTKLHLGLDLQGGAQLQYVANLKDIPEGDRESAIKGTRDVIERRVNALGVSEPVVQTNKVGTERRLIVELAGVKDVNQAIKAIGETPVLEFKQQQAAPKQEQDKTTQEVKKKQELEFNNAQIGRAKVALSRVKKNLADFPKIADELSEDPGNSGAEGAKKGGDLGWVKKGALVPEFDKQIFEILKDNQTSQGLIETQFGWHIIQRLEERKNEAGETEVHSRHILFKKWADPDVANPQAVWANTQLSGKHIKRAQVQFDPNTGLPIVGLTFNDEGAKLFEQITEANVGKQVAIFLDGGIISAPTVQQKITGGNAVITGNFTLVESRQLVQRLNAGALPVPITLIAQQTVGPTLGKTSVEKSFFAALIGIILVGVFMIGVYRLPGMISVVSLAIYIAVVLALFKLFSVTLTLAGIAGFIMSIGMAVDANVLIFERMKEELRKGQGLTTAIHEGFIRAWPSIRDSNISGLITALLLLWLGSSSIKGFAITLSIGIIISIFSAVTVSRIFLLLISAMKPLRSGWFWGAKNN